MLITTLEEVQSHLGMWIAKLQPGEELLITQDDHPVARLIAEPKGMHKARQPGSAIGQLKVVEEDNVHLDDFREYMP
jgi:antitoxin (DNA-binding transcriptional repressor) of toxin-antitoxin stability system